MAGTGSLAMQYYAQLAVKNVQNATISWVLYTRISTIHPLNSHKIGNKTPFNLLENLGKVLEWAKSAEQLSSSSVDRMLGYGQYNMLVDTVTSEGYGAWTFSIWIVLSEFHRVARFSEMPDYKEFSRKGESRRRTLDDHVC